jgi:hypothetical protein
MSLATRIVDTNHITFFPLSATYNQLGSSTLLPPTLGIHGFMYICAALMCQPIYFPRKKRYIKVFLIAAGDRFAF